MKFNVHAGHNPDGKIACGAVGLIKESTQARKVKNYVIKYLKKAGHTVYDCTCNNGTSQSDVLNKIVAKCNAHTVDLDISIHFNSGAGDQKGNGKTTGAEVLVYALNKEPKDVASGVVKEIAKLGIKNRGVKAKPELRVLNSTKSLAMLIECCFVDDADDVKIYKAKKMAQAITVGILNSYGVSKYKTTRKVNAFNAKGKKIKTVKKEKNCNIDKVEFINGCIMGHRKKADDWIKLKYANLI
ncbi:MAG: N-acetylmuramoyl-L-alanine amidase [Eubacterium sp.]